MINVITKVDIPQPQPFAETDAEAKTVGAGYRFTVPITATEPLAIHAGHGKTFYWTPTELVFGDKDGNLDYIVGSAPSKLTLRNREARYYRTFPSSDEVHIAQPNGSKYWLILHEPPREPASHLSEEIWFAVSGIVGGIPLPAGRHEEIEADGFRFPQPIAEDLMGAMVAGWYEVVDSDAGQQLFICVPADWLLDSNRVYPIKVDPTVIVGNDMAAGAIVSLPDETRTRVAFIRTPTTVYVRYSKDDGQTWLTPVSGDQIPGTWTDISEIAACQADGRIWVLLGDDEPNALYHYMVTPNESANSYTWSARVTMASPNKTTYWGTHSPTIEVIPKSSGQEWLVVCAAIRTEYTIDKLYVRNITWKADGTYSSGSLVTLVSAQDNAYYALEEVRIIKDSSYNLHMVYTQLNKATYYRKGTYDGSTVTWGNSTSFEDSRDRIEVTMIDNTLYVASCSWPPTYSLKVHRRDVDGTWTEILSLSDVDRACIAREETEGKVWLVYRDITSGLLLRIYDGTSWEGPIVVDEALTKENQSTLPMKCEPFVIESTLITLVRLGQTIPYTIAAIAVHDNRAPLAPSKLTRPNFDAKEPAVFSWTFNDPNPDDSQSAYQLQIRVYGSDTNVVDTGEVQSPYTSYILPANSLINGQTYQWRVRTADQSGEWSPWSEYAVFQTGPRLVATILYPTEGTIVNIGEVTVQWSVMSQQSVVIRLYDANLTTVLQEVEVLSSTVRSKTITGLENHQSYQVSVQAVSIIGVVGEEVFSGVFHVEYTPPPTPQVTANVANGFIELGIFNPEPSETEPPLVGNDIYRRPIGGEWIKLASLYPCNTVYLDYEAASGQTYEYLVKVIAANDTVSASNIVSATLKIPYGLWLHDPLDPSGTAHFFEYYEANFQDSPKLSASDFMFAGRTHPVTQFNAKAMERPVKFRLALPKDTDDLTALENLFYRRTTLCLRDARGRKLYGTIKELPITDEKWGATADIEFTVVDYKEGA